jgi:hypothetical protein
LDVVSRKSNKEGSLKATATYTVKQWKEEAWQTLSPEVKLTKASVEFALTGEIEAKVTEEYLMFYSYFDEKDPHKSSAEYIGMMHLAGKVAGKSGSFALDDSGLFEGGSAYSTLRILEGSGTGDLKGIKGTGKYRADQKGSHFELEYDFA